MIKSILLTGMLLTGGNAAAGTIENAPHNQQADNFHTFEYTITSIEGNDYYGHNPSYTDFPGLYFTADELKGNVNVGDTVISVFNHDDLVIVYKEVK